MGIKLAEIRRAFVADAYLKSVAPNMSEEQRAIVVLRLEYFDRVGVRLCYMARDIAKHGGNSPELEAFRNVACDILGLASLVRPFHRRPIEELEDVMWAVETGFVLYRAADALLKGGIETAKALVAEIVDKGKPTGWGSVHSARFDKQIKGLMEISVGK